MKTIDKRMDDANKRIAENNAQQSRKQKLQQKIDSRRNYVIGGLVTQFFPALLKIEPGRSRDENLERFKPLVNILTVLAESPELLQELQSKANQRNGCPIDSGNV